MVKKRKKKTLQEHENVLYYENVWDFNSNLKPAVGTENKHDMIAVKVPTLSKF